MEEKKKQELQWMVDTGSYLHTLGVTNSKIFDDEGILNEKKQQKQDHLFLHIGSVMIFLAILAIFININVGNTFLKILLYFVIAVILHIIIVLPFISKTNDTRYKVVQAIAISFKDEISEDALNQIEKSIINYLNLPIDYSGVFKNEPNCISVEKKKNIVGIRLLTLDTIPEDVNRKFNELYALISLITDFLDITELQKIKHADVKTSTQIIHSKIRSEYEKNDLNWKKRLGRDKEYSIQIKKKSRNKWVIGKPTRYINIADFSLFFILIGGVLFAGIDLLFKGNLSVFLVKVSVLFFSIYVSYFLLLLFQAKLIPIPGLKKSFQVEFFITEGREHITHYLYIELKRILAPYYHKSDLFKTNHLGKNNIQFSWPSLGNIVHFVDNIDQGKIRFGEKLTITGKPRIIDEIMELLVSEFGSTIAIPSYNEFQKNLSEKSLSDVDIKFSESEHSKEEASIDSMQLRNGKWIPFLAVIVFMIILVVGSIALETNSIPNNYQIDNLVIDQSFDTNQTFSITVKENTNLFMKVSIEDSGAQNISTRLSIEGLSIVDPLNFNSKNEFYEYSRSFWVEYTNEIHFAFTTEDAIHFIVYIDLDIPTQSNGPSFYLSCIFVLQLFLGYMTSKKEYANSDPHPYLEKVLNYNFSEYKPNSKNKFIIWIFIYILIFDGGLWLFHIYMGSSDISFFRSYSVLFESFTLVPILMFSIVVMWLPYYFANLSSTYYTFNSNFIVALFQTILFAYIHPVPFFDWYRFIY